MTDSERRHGTSLSGWCMTRTAPGRFDCEHCRWSGCPHECHANGPVAQEISGAKGSRL